MRSFLLPAFEMSEHNSTNRRRRSVPAAAHAVSAIRRHWLTPRHASSVAAADNIGVGDAFVTSERLYDGSARHHRRVFGCASPTGTVAADAGFIAHECDAGGMHIMAEDIHRRVCSTVRDRARAGRPAR